MASRSSRSELSGIFDFFARLFSPPSVFKKGEMLPIVRPETLPGAPRKEERKLAPYEIFKPKPRELIQRPSGVIEFFMAPVPMMPTVTPAPPEKEFWEGLIPPEEEKALLEPETFLKKEAVERALNRSEWPYGEPPLWMQTRWRMPTTLELTSLLREKWDLNGMFEYVLSQVERPGWSRQVEESAHLGEPAAMDIEPVAYAADPRADITKFLNIPDVVIEEYGRYGPEGTERFVVEVLREMSERVGKAMDILRPTPELRGWFELEPDQDMNFWIRYKETKYPPR